MKKFFSVYLLLAIALIACKDQNNDNHQDENMVNEESILLDEPIVEEKKIVKEKKVVTPKKKKNKVSTTAKSASSKPAHRIGNLSFVALEDLESRMKKEKRKVIVDVYTDWCTPCKMMEAKTFTDDEVQKVINESFYMVKFNAEGPENIHFKGKNWGNPGYVPNRRGRNANHELSSFFNVRGYPTLAILNHNLEIEEKLVGYKTPEQLISELNRIK